MVNIIQLKLLLTSKLMLSTLCWRPTRNNKAQRFRTNSMLHGSAFWVKGLASDVVFMHVTMHLCSRMYDTKKNNLLPSVGLAQAHPNYFNAGFITTQTHLTQ